jgi:signal transduction histidine kinase
MNLAQADFPCGLVEADHLGLVVEVNATVATWVGACPQSLKGRPVESLFTPASAALFRSHLLPRLVQEGHVEEFPLALQSPSGHPLDMLVYAARNGDRPDDELRLVLAPHLQRPALDEGLVRARQAAEKVRDAQTEFLGRVSHELRTPLNAILGFAQLLQASESADLGQQQRRQIQLIADAGGQLLNLVEEVLDISKFQHREFAVSLSRVDALLALQRALDMAGPQAATAGVQLLPADVEPGLALMADERRLAQVLSNLISNAIKYNRPEGTVRLRAIRQGSRACLSVQDSGRGMTPLQRLSLFQPFNRLGAETTAVPGAGLGLVITRQLVQRMGGSLQVDSDAGVGTTFHLWLPLAQSDPRHPAPAITDARAHPHAPAREG